MHDTPFLSPTPPSDHAAVVRDGADTGPAQQHAATRGKATLPESTMRAIVQDKYGSADVLRLARIARPEIASSEVLLRVHAAGLDRGCWHMMPGRPTCCV